MNKPEDSEQRYLICYQMNWYGRVDWTSANAVTTRDPGLWLAEMMETYIKVAHIVLLSAVPISPAGYDAVAVARETL